MARKPNCMEVRQQGVKEETLTQTSRRGGDGHPSGEAAAGRLGVPHSCVDKQLGSKTARMIQGSRGEIKPQTSDCKHLWGLRQWEKLPASQESLLERPTGS